MSQHDLATRMGISQQAVSQMEGREVDGSVTLRALGQAARALGGRLVYAIVPSDPIEQVIERRAQKLARQLVLSVRHTMRLEDQATPTDLNDRVAELAEQLKSSPDRLWTTALDE
jgi:predicted DNA-binding mobile mystery protein A